MKNLRVIVWTLCLFSTMGLGELPPMGSQSYGGFGGGMGGFGGGMGGFGGGMGGFGGGMGGFGGGMGGFGGGMGGFGGGMGGFGGMGMGNNGQSRQAANEILKLGQETSKGIQESMKNFSSGQEKYLQNFYSSLKDTQTKEDNSKLLDSLAKASQWSGSDSATGMGTISDSIVKAIDEDSKIRMQEIEMIGKATIKAPIQPGQMQNTLPQLAAKGRSFSRGPLNQLMGLSGKLGSEGSGSATGLPNMGSIHPSGSLKARSTPYNPPRIE